MHPAALTAAVAPYRVVREVRASASFPHGLRIRVVEQLPVAALTVAGGRTAVAADGVVLGPALLRSSLPLLGAGLSAANAPRPLGQRVHGASLLGSLTLLGAAPAPLARAVARVYMGPQGVTAAMHDGLLVYLRDATRAHAKWLSLARVLADQSSAGASYVDVRLPERPAAGFPGAAAPETSASGPQPSSASEPRTAAELEAGLTAALGLSSPGENAQSPSEASSAPSEAASGTSDPNLPGRRSRSHDRHDPGSIPERTGSGGLNQANPQPEVDSSREPILRWWSRVRGSATNVAETGRCR